MSSKSKNFYEILNLNKDCKREDIKKSFIKLSKEVHPDKNSSKDAHEMFVHLREAYMTLNNPITRKMYDDHLAMERNYNFRTSRTGKDGLHSHRHSDFTSHQYSYKTQSNETYSGSRILFRLSLLPKAVFVTALVVMTFLGGGLQLYFLKNGYERRMRIMENETHVASLILERARQQAKLLGNENQMKRLKEEKLSICDSDAQFQDL